MNNLEINQIPSTLSAIVIASALSSLPSLGINENFSQNNIGSASYIPNGSSPTYSQNKRLPQNSISHASIFDSFEHSTSQFYSALQSQQEPLGGEFEKVLYDNLWDLYES